MLIGKKEFFTKEHIEAHQNDTPVILAEQVVHCLELVALLTYHGLDFMFKGGNSLLVLLENPRRFSIDVDISTGESKEKIEEILDKLIESSDVFTKWVKRPHKTKIWLPMTSYYIFYNSHFTEPEETSIMLDAQLKLSEYEKSRKPVCCGSFYQSDQKVLVPTVSSLIGDKLLTLGPATLGIPLGKNKEAQRLKHSFDISLLSENYPHVPEIRKSIEICLKQENNLQGTEYNLEEVYNDTMDLCGSVIKYEEEPFEGRFHPYLKEIIIGRMPFADHIFEKHYSWQDLQTDMAKTAFTFTAVMCKKITTEIFNSVIHCKKEDMVQDETTIHILDTIKESNPVAYFYWRNIIKYTGKNPLH